MSAVALQRHDPASASKSAQRALKERQTVRAYVYLGRARLASGDLSEARAALERGESIDPGDPDLGELRAAIERQRSTDTVQ